MNKIMIISRICFVLCLYPLFSARAAIAATQPALASANWAVTAPHNLAKERPTRSEVEQLLGLGDTIENSPSLCSFTFADLRRTGILSLVASSDSSGRGFCNGIDVIDRTAYGFETTDLPSTEIGEGTDVTTVIRDLARDGRLELVLNVTVGGYQGGAHCGLEWPVIFAWTGTSYADVSAQFKDYYRQHLAELNHQLNPPTSTPAPDQAEGFERLPLGNGGTYYTRLGKSSQSVPVATPTPTSQGYHMDCLNAEAAKTERFLGISSDAGIGDAIKWSESDDPLTREFAATIFYDIGKPEALGDLKSLAADSDQSVAAGAKVSLQAAQRGSVSSYGQVNSEPLELGN